MPHKPNTKVKARILVLGRKALEMRAEGLHNSAIADQLGITLATAKRYIARALSTESMFPSSLTHEAVAELRILEGEKLNRVWAMVSKALDVVDPHDAHKVARLAEATARLSEQQCKIWGLYQPQRIVEESLRLEFKKVDGRVEVEFDREQLRPTGEPIGLYDCDGEPYERPYDPHQIE